MLIFSPLFPLPSAISAGWASILLSILLLFVPVINGQAPFRDVVLLGSAHIQAPSAEAVLWVIKGRKREAS